MKFSKILMNAYFILCLKKQSFQIVTFSSSKKKLHYSSMCHYFEALQYLLIIYLNEFLPVRNRDGFKVVWNDISDDHGYRIDHSLIEHCRRNL